MYTTKQIQATTAGQPAPLRRETMFRTFTATDLLAMEFPEVPYVIPGILPIGVTLLAGKPKIGKSFMALGFCVAVATGGVALGTKPVERGEALYLPLEDHPQRLASRLRKVTAGDADLDGLRLRTDWPRLDEGGADLLDEFVSTHPRTRLVVIDTLARVRPRTSGQNVYAEDYAALEDLVRIAGEQGVAIVVVHHLRKMAAADPLDEINASTGLSASADGVLILRKDRASSDAVLYVDGRDIVEPTELALRFDRDVAGWTIIGSAEEYRLSEERRKVIAALREADEPVGPKVVAEILGKTDDQEYGAIRELMSQMAESGDISRVSYGKYVPKDADTNDSADTSDADEDSVRTVRTVSRYPRDSLLEGRLGGVA